MTSDQQPDPIESASSFPFEATVDRLIVAIEGAGMTIFARIDHAANARQAGISMAPTIVLVYGNAKGGTPVMQAVPQTALDLPLRVLVREDTGGRTLVSFHPVVAMLRQAGVPDTLARRLEPAQHILTTAIQS